MGFFAARDGRSREEARRTEAEYLQANIAGVGGRSLFLWRVAHFPIHDTGYSCLHDTSKGVSRASRPALWRHDRRFKVGSQIGEFSSFYVSPGGSTPLYVALEGFKKIKISP